MLVLNYPCFSILILQVILQSVLSARLIGFNGDRYFSPSVPLKCGDELYFAYWFVPSLPTTIYCHGFNEKYYDDTVFSMASALYDTYRNQRNIIILDWDQESCQGDFAEYAGYLLRGIPGSYTVGISLSQVIVDIVNKGANPDIHIIGFSLGAQLAATCGKNTKSLGFTVPRITGLDAAGPAYNKDDNNTIRLSVSCAACVDNYHSNSGDLGIEVGTGTVDTWLNYSPTFPVIQPGCPNVGQCSHTRAVYYYIESIRNPTAFQAAQAECYTAWTEGRTGPTIAVGHYIESCAYGNYFLTTNGSPQYGKGKEGAMYCRN